MRKQQIIDWLNELADKNPENFSEYFFDDVRNFVLNQESLLEEIDLFSRCKSKDDVHEWLNDVAGYIVMKLDVDLLLESYFH